MEGRGELWSPGGALAQLPTTAAAEQDTEILSLLGSGDGPDLDANIIQAPTRTVGIAAHLKLGIRSFPVKSSPTHK